MTRFCQFAAVAAKEAMEDAGLPNDSSHDRQAWGASIGVGLGGLQDIEDTAVLIRDSGSRRVSPFFLPYVIPNMAAGIVSRNHGLKGPNICTTTACASGTHAIGEAFLYIQQGMADLMLAGGSEAAISPLGVTSFANMKALSKGAGDPQKASRPFDRDRDGFVMGEGCGLLVLEELGQAQRRGAKIYAEVVGYGLSGDAYHITAPAPDHEGGYRCMQMALKTAKLRTDQINYINAHGTSTKMNDHLESVAIENLFKDSAKKIAVSSTKGVTGHCLGAAGGIEGVFTALSVYSSLVPPTANYEFKDPDCRLDYVPAQLERCVSILRCPTLLVLVEPTLVL